jgi:hypothetical protein
LAESCPDDLEYVRDCQCADPGSHTSWG